MAILIGDLALAWADDLAAAVPARIAPVWARMRTEVLSGQVLDIANEAARDESLAAAERVIAYKTAGYTVARPLELGAVLGARMSRSSRSCASSVCNSDWHSNSRDDLLGVYGDPAVTGKPSGDDLITGKRTVLIAEGLAAPTMMRPHACGDSWELTCHAASSPMHGRS